MHYGFSPDAVWVRFTIRSASRDEEPGLPENSGNLYNAFVQNQDVITGPVQSVGIGLYVVQTNGRVDNCPASSGGACFRVEWTKENLYVR